MFAVVKACIGIIIPYRHCHCARNFLKWLTIDGIYKDINDIKKKTLKVPSWKQLEKVSTFVKY